MKGFSKNFLWAIVSLVSIALVFSALFNSDFSAKTERLSLNELVRRINAGEVKNIEVSGDELAIALQGDKKAVSQKEAEAGLSETLANYGVKPDALSLVDITMKEESGFRFWMGILLPSLLPVLLLLLLFSWFFRQAKGGMNQAFTFGKANLKLFAHTKDKVTFKDVAGLKEAKEELEEVVDFLKNPKKFLDMGARIPRGVLLVGPPGTGKTLMARAVAGQSNVPFFHMSASEFVEMFVGVGASRVRSLFDTAKKAAPSLVFVDEIDAVGRERGAGLGGGHDEREQTLNQILVEMDGFDRDTNVIVICASVTGDTPVLIKKSNECFLKPIQEIIDSYYKDDADQGEKAIQGDFQALGYASAPRGPQYFHRATFRNVRSVFRHKVDTIYEISYLGGTVRATGNHSIFVRTHRGIEAKAVSLLQPGDILVDLPYKVNRTNKKLCEVRGYEYESSEFTLELPVWQPLFSRFPEIKRAYEYALHHAEDVSQMKIGSFLGFSQRTIGKWQQGICVPRELSRHYYQHASTLPERISVTPDLMRLFGYYTAEGYSRKELDFCFHTKEDKKTHDLKNLMESAFGLRPSVERHITSNAVNIIYYSKPLAEFFAYYCGRGAHNKHIPSFLFTAPREYFVEYLRGYFAGDGYKNKVGCLEMTSVSKRLILELNWLSRMHGFKSYVHSFVTREGRRIRGGKPLRSGTAWRIGFGKTQNPFEAVPGKASVKRAIVRSVKKMPFDGYVYDFCGCENEAFFGGESPVLLHNTNRPDILDPALLRPGRFDRRVILDMPDIADREEILKIHATGKPFAEGVDLHAIAVRTPGFSGADLANLMNESALWAARHNRKQITQIDIIDSIEKVMLGPARRSRKVSEHEKEVTAYHEAGHALVAAALKDTDPVQKVSIVSRGLAGGYTIKLPLEEKRLKTKAQFLAELAVAFGGYVAELVKFKEVTTGSSSDISQATRIAHRIVTRYGMSDVLGPRTFGKSQELIFLGREISTEKDYSEDVATKIDAEVNVLIQTALSAAKKIISAHKAALEKIAKTLIEKESVEHEEFYKIVGEFGLKPISIR